MAKPRNVPSFTPEEMEQVEAGRRAVLDSYVAPKQITPPTPAPTSGQTSPTAGGSWWRKGGTVVKAQGGGFMGSVAQGFQQGFGGDMPTKKDKKKTGASGGSSPNAPAPPTNTAGADPTDAGNWAGDSGVSASDPASGAAAGETYRRGGLVRGSVKHGSPKLSAPCTDTKVCRR